MFIEKLNVFQRLDFFYCLHVFIVFLYKLFQLNSLCVICHVSCCISSTYLEWARRDLHFDISIDAICMNNKFFDFWSISCNQSICLIYIFGMSSSRSTFWYIHLHISEYFWKSWLFTLDLDLKVPTTHHQTLPVASSHRADQESLWVRTSSSNRSPKKVFTYHGPTDRQTDRKGHINILIFFI